MARILVQRGSVGSSSSNQNRSSTSASSSNSASSSTAAQQQPSSNTQAGPVVKDDSVAEDEQIFVDELSEYCDVSENKVEGKKGEDQTVGSLKIDQSESEKLGEDETPIDDVIGSGNLMKEFGGMHAAEKESDAAVGSSFQVATGSSYPPPPPLPPPKPSLINSSPRRFVSTDPNAVQTGSSRRAAGWPGVSNRSSPTGSHPSSPRSYCEGEGYNSADEQSPCFNSSYDDSARERQFEIELRRVKGWEVKKMLEDGNCLFRAVADQVYGDSESYDMVRQMCIDYMEQERDHFSQFITEGVTSYCKRKRRDKVYGNNVEIQALSEMYNRPIHIYSYSTDPINIFHGSYNTDIPPIRLSYHHGNHYNSLVDPRRLTIGAGLGFSSLQGVNIDKDQVKAAIKSQQDQQIDNALLAEGRLKSDLELTEKEIERMVMEASRAEYQQLCVRESCSSRAEPSCSAAISGSSSEGSVLSGSVQIMLSMGFSYLQVMEAYSIFGDDVDSMVCYLIETSSNGRRKGKATTE